MADRYQAVLLFGCPGAGKGTQGAMLGAREGYFHLSTGDMFRSLDKESELGRTFASYSEKGELVPDELTLELWSQYVNAQIANGSYDPSKDLLLLDGIPRTVAQAELMDGVIDVCAVVHLVANDPDAMVARLQKRANEQQRADDAKEEVVRNRLEVYARETRPVLDHYDPSVVHEIDAIGTLDEVQSAIEGVLKPIRSRVISGS